MRTAIQVKGAAELERAFRQLRREVLAELRPALLRIAEVVRVDAEQKALGNITNIGSDWSQMRKGAVAKGVYIAPKMRNRGGSPRGNLAQLLLTESMLPAAEANEEKMLQEFENLVTIAAARSGLL